MQCVKVFKIQNLESVDEGIRCDFSTPFKFTILLAKFSLIT